MTDPVLVTDGGLLVPGLGAAWEPTTTRRFAGPDASPVDLAMVDRCDLLVGEHRRIGWVEAATVVAPGRDPVTYVAESPLGVLATSAPDSRDWARRVLGPVDLACPEFGLSRLSDLTSAERDARPDHRSLIGREPRRYFS